MQSPLLSVLFRVLIAYSNYVLTIRTKLNVTIWRWLASRFSKQKLSLLFTPRNMRKTYKRKRSRYNSRTPSSYGRWGWDICGTSQCGRSELSKYHRKTLKRASVLGSVCEACDYCVKRKQSSLVTSEGYPNTFTGASGELHRMALMLWNCRDALAGTFESVINIGSCVYIWGFRQSSQTIGDS